MQEKPLVTIICLSYNHEKFVVESLNSVMNQNYSSIELIIIDDCSTDNSKSVIEKWLIDHPTIHFIVNSSNLGNTKAMALPTANKKKGKTKSVGVIPCQVACFNGAYILPQLPGLFTNIMSATVAPLNTSSE